MRMKNNKVYIVNLEWQSIFDTDPTMLIGVFATRKDATKYMDSHSEDFNKFAGDPSVYISEWEIGMGMELSDFDKDMIDPDYIDDDEDDEDC